MAIRIEIIVAIVAVVIAVVVAASEFYLFQLAP